MWAGAGAGRGPRSRRNGPRPSGGPSTEDPSSSRYGCSGRDAWSRPSRNSRKPARRPDDPASRSAGLSGLQRVRPHPPRSKTGLARNFHAKIAKTAKASWAIPLHRMGSAKIFPMRPQGAFKKSHADLCVLCVITATFGFRLDTVRLAGAFSICLRPRILEGSSLPGRDHGPAQPHIPFAKKDHGNH